MNKFRYLAAAAVLLLACCSGCRSTAWYQEKAVERAREYALENTPLTIAQEAHIRTCDPVLLGEPLFGGSSGIAAAGARNQICVTWLLPDTDGEYCMVFGVSTGRMIDWYPEQLIRKRFPEPDQVRLKAVVKGREYAKNNLFADISASEMVRVRFAEPEMIRTDFPIFRDLKGSPEKTGSAAGQIQFSLVWRADDPSQRVFVAGYLSREGILSSFTPGIGGRIPLTELNAATVPVK
ncbi:MAG: hypothetical protein IJC73_04645 [Lentisphaeria bacterium]|nr:hypothetical protein [Lentisphaeria bacterium]